MFTKQRRALRMTLAAVTLAGSALTVTAVGAAPAFAGTAPSCVRSYTYNSGHSVRVTNNCTRAYRVKAIWAYATDSPCTYLSPNHYFTSDKSWPARFDGVNLC